MPSPGPRESLWGNPFGWMEGQLCPGSGLVFTPFIFFRANLREVYTRIGHQSKNNLSMLWCSRVTICSNTYVLCPIRAFGTAVFLIWVWKWRELWNAQKCFLCFSSLMKETRPEDRGTTIHWSSIPLIRCSAYPVWIVRMSDSKCGLAEFSHTVDRAEL